MTDPAKNDNADIDASGFDMDSKEQATKKKGVSSINRGTTHEQRKQRNILNALDTIGTDKMAKILGVSALLLCVVAGGAYWTMSDDSGDNDILSGYRVEQSTGSASLPETEPPKRGDLGNAERSEADSLSVEQGPDGVKVNGYHDLVATMLLQNYPTREELRQELSRVRGADVSKEELDAFLLSVRNNADDIRRLKASKSSDGGNKELAEVINDVKNTLKGLREDTIEQKASITDLGKRLDKLEKNSGWYHNRLSRLEGNPIAAEKITKSTNIAPQALDVRRIQLESQSAWTVRGASENLAFIQNIRTGKRLRVTRGFDIPGCGQVTDISPSNQKVTTTSCVIKN